MQVVRERVLVLNTSAVADKEVTEAILRHFTFNLKAKTRKDTMEGKEYLVVPMVMLTEGVHSGSNGPILYNAEELAKFPESWNAKPVVVYHPMINGKGVSACDPKIFSEQKVGVIMNTKWEAPKLKAEAWLDVERCNAVDPRILSSIKKGNPLEVSTGLFTDNESKSGTWNSEAYEVVAKNYRPDHLAILPDQKGACSLEDGAGLLVNEASFDSTRSLICAALRAEHGENVYCYVEDVFKSFFVYSRSGKLYRQNYTVTDTSATLSGEPSEVVRVVQYRSPDGTVIANVTKEILNMNKAAMIALLVSNGLFLEGDRKILEGMDEARLQKFLDATKKPEPSTTTNAEQKPILKLEDVQKPKTQSVQEYISNAPPEIAAMLAAGLKSYDSEKTALVKAITSNKANTFTPEVLQNMNVETLRSIAALATPTSNAPQGVQSPLNFGGLADAYAQNARTTAQAPVTNIEVLEEVALDFTKK